MEKENIFQQLNKIGNLYIETQIENKKLKRENQTFRQNYTKLIGENELIKKIDDLQNRLENEVATNILKCKEIERLKRENKIMENYLQLIIDIGYDYDGYNDVEGLKNIIDELVQYANLGKNKNDKKSMSIDGNNKRYNILGEEIKESD